MRRILSLWLPQLPLDRRVRLGDPRAAGVFAIVAETGNAWRLTHLNAPARQAGLAPGMTLPDARAICPALLSEPADPAGEAALLRALWRWADRFSPRIAQDPPDGLLMDVSGCAHLFGGEHALAETIVHEAGDLQITARIGVADTKGAAAALARYAAAPVAIAEAGRTAQALAGLPLAALGLAPSLVQDIRRTGLQTIGQLCGIRAGELARRYGLSLTSALERSLGHAHDPVAPKGADPVYAARATLPEPAGRLEDIEAILLRLAGSVCGRLRAAGCGARRYTLTVRPVDGSEERLTIGFAKPGATEAAVLQQFGAPLSRLSLPFGADVFRLEAGCVEPMHPRQAGLDGRSQKEDDRTDLISTLGNRLGFDRVRLFAPGDSHLPEREFITLSAMDHPGQRPWQPSPRQRPVRLFTPAERVRVEVAGRPPLRFEWRRKSYETARAIGPERLGGEWWRPEGGALRDYWRVETRAGPRLWLVTWPGEAEAGWCVAGRFP